MPRTSYQVVFLLFSVSFILFSCGKKQDEDIRMRLQTWDAMIDSVPKQVSDSLKQLNPEKLSRDNRAYYSLMTTIADDKNYTTFTNDSLITYAREYYEQHNSDTEKLIRALAYQGIVRTRMGIVDSTAYEPLKEAARVFEETENSNFSLGYLINYFLGDIHYNNQNYRLADQYYNQSLNFAKQEKDSVHVFDSYLAHYWNEIVQKNYDVGKKYLDSLTLFYGKLPEKDFFILNAQSAYYSSTSRYDNALMQEKALLSLEPAQLEKIDIARVYFNISYLYNNLNELDSAMLYAQVAIDNIKDSTNRQNYIFYSNVANIAEKQQNYLLANKYRKTATTMYQQSVKDRLDTQIMELEKQYDLSEAENIALKSRQRLLTSIIWSLALGLLFVLSIFLNFRMRRISKMKLSMVRHEAETQALQMKMLTEEANKRKWLMNLYGHISNRLTVLHDSFETLSQRYVSSNPKIHASMHEILHEADNDIKDLPDRLIPDKDTFFNYTQIDDKNNDFTPNEKLFLMLLSCNADNRQIATFMNTSIESIRVRKSQLKKKVNNLGYSADIFNQ